MSLWRSANMPHYELMRINSILNPEDGAINTGMITPESSGTPENLTPEPSSPELDRPTSATAAMPMAMPTVTNLVINPKSKRCAKCNKMVSKKAYADHMNYHLLERDDIAAVTLPSQRCKACMRKHHECRVFEDISIAGRKTVRCRNCLHMKESCSFIQDYRPRMTQGLTRHPALGG